LWRFMCPLFNLIFLRYVLFLSGKCPLFFSQICNSPSGRAIYFRYAHRLGTYKYQTCCIEEWTGKLGMVHASAFGMFVKVCNIRILLTYLLTYLLHGAESFLIS
jgi:hypothetical protein